MTRLRQSTFVFGFPSSLNTFVFSFAGPGEVKRENILTKTGAGFILLRSNTFVFELRRIVLRSSNMKILKRSMDIRLQKFFGEIRRSRRLYSLAFPSSLNIFMFSFAGPRPGEVKGVSSLTKIGLPGLPAPPLRGESRGPGKSGVSGEDG